MDSEHAGLGRRAGCWAAESLGQIQLGVGIQHGLENKASNLRGRTVLQCIRGHRIYFRAQLV